MSDWSHIQHWPDGKEVPGERGEEGSVKHHIQRPESPTPSCESSEEPGPSGTNEHKHQVSSASTQRRWSKEDNPPDLSETESEPSDTNEHKHQVSSASTQRRWSKEDIPPDLSETESGPSDTKDSGLMGKLKRLKIEVQKAIHSSTYRIQAVKKYLDGEKEEDSKLRRETIGEKDPTIPNKTILLVGETGAGKSTWIDAMLNHLMGRKYEDHEWCTVMDEAQNLSETQTQTTAVTVYDIFGFHNENFPYSLTIIDTPGFVDTRGVVEDRQIARILQSLFIAEDGVKQLDAVGLVLKAGTNRVSDRQTYIFNSVVSLFGKDLEKKIVPLITHSSGMTHSNELHALQVAKVKMAMRDEKEPMYFSFNNCPNDFTSDKEKEKRATKYAWETSQDGMNEFLEFLKKVETQDLKQTADVLMKRIQLEALCNNLMEQIEFIEMKQMEIHKVKASIGHLDNEAANAITIVKVDEAYKVLERIGGSWDNKATRCTICEENCHYPGCTWEWSPYMCRVMRDQNCTSCAGKCHYSKHVRDENKYVSKTRRVKKAVEDVQKKYTIWEEKGQRKELLAAIEKNLEDTQKERETLISGIYQCIVKLDDIALNRDSFYTYIHLDFVINKLKETGGNDERIQKMIEVKDRMEKEIKYAESLTPPSSN